MAKQTWNNPINKNVDWGGDATTGNLPVSGEMVQRFIKESLNGKAGLFHYDATNNRYLVFADADARDEYLLDPTQTKLIIGTFDAPFNYTAEINLTSAAYNAVFLGSTGNYIDFTFDIKNKQGASTGENVTITYTFIRNAVRQTVTETRKFGDAVHFNIDKYIGEGTNTIMVGVTGQTSLAATTVAITYQVVNLAIEDELDIAKSYNLTNGSQQIEIPFTVSGHGTKVVEWYLDGEMLPFVKVEDEVVDVIATRTKYITLSNLQQGTHSLQIRAYSLVNGEKFYTDTLYRDIIVYTSVSSNVIIGVATTIPRGLGVLGANDNVTIYDMVQYIPYTLRFATYSPSNAANTEVTIKLDGVVKGTVNSSNGIENKFILTSTSSGDKVLNLSASGISKDIATIVQETDMNIQEITSGLVLDFNASGKTNNSSDRSTWTDGIHTGTLTGFNWNNASGWVDGRLEMNAGSSLAIDLAPLSGKPTDTGKTLEVEWSTKNVTNDNAVICDLRDANGVGILITATKVHMRSADGVVVETEYKSDENVRIGFVINKATGATNKRLSFIYANGIVSRAEQWAEADSYTSDKTILFTASEEAEVSLKSIRIYDAALSSDNMLNNYILYRDTIAEMMEVYDRNDVYEEGTVVFSPEKMMGRLPVMIVTGDIPTLENTSDKDTQIVVDIEYYNLQDSSKSFTMKNAAMRPQGTSSMGYPKKNFRIYTQKVANTEVYDSTGKPIADKLYSFKDGAQPVDCWCLKADYAESSGTHNTGIARLWNEALYNAQIDGEYKLRTEAQKKAEAAGYPYDVRTTIDGFPILLFYRPSANDDLIFIGKYNFNNDKSTESVFGFKGIPNFNNSKMQCWEVLNNGNALALFTSVDGFDSDWSEAFESRYPDTKTPYTGDLKAFCEWMANVSQKDFATQKWEHLNVYMMAAYWVYLMRHAAADQFVKNAMFTSEDGQHFYYILYDNDTINGLINTGRLRIKPTDDRQTVDETGSYVFAGHDSRLWNMLEADDEFKDIVSAVDNALYSAGISYANTIRIFDEEQADKWVEKVYNQDAQYKYVGPYVEKGIDNLFMLQGKRDLHRRWWLAKRFSIYDAKYVSGTYKSQAIEIKCLNGTEAGQKFSIVAGYPLDYGYGINNIPRDFGVSLEIGDAYEFTTKEVVNLGDPVRIYGAPNIAEIDFSKMSDRLAVVTIANVYDENLGTKLTKLVLGNASKANYEVTEISGLKQAEALEYLDIQGMTKMTSLDLSNHAYFKTLKAKGSGISSVAFAKGAPVERLELPATMRVLSLEQLPYLHASNISFENISKLAGLTIVSCPNVSKDYSLIQEWVNTKTTADANCSLVMDGVDWSGVSGEEFLKVASLGNVSLKGKVVLTDITEEQGDVFVSVFGDHVFDENAEFFIDAPTTVTVSGKTSLLEGEGATYNAKVYPPKAGTIEFSLFKTRTGVSINATTGALTTTENGLATSNVVVRATFTPSNGDAPVIKDYAVSIVKRTYPSNATIEGDENPITNGGYTWDTTTEGINGSMTATWALNGNIVDYVKIDSSDLNGCSLSMTYPPLGVVNGTLTLTLKKAYNGATILTATKTLSAELSGVIITGRSNSPIQAALYNAGLVANETHTFKHEVEKITASQLQTGTTASTSVFYSQRNNITSFDEFKYFTSITVVPQRLFQGCGSMVSVTLPNTVTELSDYVFQNCSSLVDIVLSNSLKKVGSSTFASCSSLVEVVFPEGFTTTGSNTFITCPSLERVRFPSTTTTIGGNVFMSCGRLSIEVAEDNPWFSSINGVLFNKAQTKLIEYAKEKIQSVYEVPVGVTTIGNYAFYHRDDMTEITFPSTLTKIGNDMFSFCVNLKTLRFNCVNAPTLDNASVFGTNASTWIGRNTYSTGENKLYIPQNASGYETGLWADPLQSASKCGFSIHGKLTIVSNKSNATFSIKYTTISGASKTVTASVGTCYLDDIKYGTSLTATPKALGDNVFDSASTTITYNGAATITNNAYVYPKNATIVGDENPVKNNTYTWSTTTANVDGAYVGTWVLSGDIAAYISIESQDSNQCKMKVVEAPTEFVNGTLTLTLKRTNGTTLATATKSLKAILEGVVITSKSNAPIQAALFEAGLVANQNYSLQEEVEKITAEQIAPNGTSIFKHIKIDHFDEFVYFTGLTSIPNECFAHCYIQSITLPESIEAIGSEAFRFCSFETFIAPSSLTTVSDHAFDYNPYLKVLDFSKSKIQVFDGTMPYCDTSGVPNAATNINIEVVYLPSTVTSIEYGTLASPNLREIHCLAASAPNARHPFEVSYGVGTTKMYAGQSLPNGEKFLYIPTNATGYESGDWLDPLQNPDKCGFSIYGKLTINSNKSSAKFNVTYTTLDGTLKTITLGVGTVYLNDVKYNTEMTVVPIAMSGYTWDWASKSITYSGNAVFENNAYIYPASVTITGASSIIGGNSETFTATVSPSNVNIGLTYTWSISGSSNATITPNGSQCTVNTNAPSAEETFTLTCVVKSSNNKVTVQDTHSVKLMEKPNFITATYNVTSTSSATTLLGSDAWVTYMEIDGIEVSKVSSYTFSTKGTHVVKLTATILNDLFYFVSSLISVDFSQFDGKDITQTSAMFRGCSNLESITWGECKFLKATSLSYVFSACAKLTSIDLSPFVNAPIVSADYAFHRTKITSIDFSSLTNAPITTMDSMCYSCSSLTSIEWGGCTFPKVTSLRNAFSDCEKLSSIDLSPFRDAPITNLSSTFYSCRGLTSIDFSPLKGTSITNFGQTFQNCSNLVSINFGDCNFPKVTTLYRTFLACLKLESIDLNPFKDANITKFSGTFNQTRSLKTIVSPWMSAPSVATDTFGSGSGTYTGQNTYNTGENTLIVPASATGYETNWATLLDATKCGFKIVRDFEDGVYIQHVDGALYSTDAWVASGNSNDDANGVAVIVGENSFVVAKESKSSLAFSNSSSASYETRITDESLALADMNGVGHTESMYALPARYPAATYCTEYIFPNGANGYLPASGELYLLSQYKDVVENALVACGGKKIDIYNSGNSKLVSSTAFAASIAWGLQLGPTWSITTINRSADTSYYIRPFTTLE